jgi:nitrogen fixation protein NifZ
MMEAVKPRFEWGQRVQAAADLFNDGSYPDRPTDALLVHAGEPGEIVQIGRQVDSGTAVYMVEFAMNQIVGCMEPELMPWQQSGEAR